VKVTAWDRCKFANRGSNCVSHCGDTICVSKFEYLNIPVVIDEKKENK